jgi:hypothetical protein
MKDDYIRFRLTEDEKQAIEDKAAAQGMTVSAFLRWVALYASLMVFALQCDTWQWDGEYWQVDEPIKIERQA